MGNKYTPDRGEEWHREQYVEKGRSTVEMAEELGLSPEAVQSRLEGYGIERRDRTVDELRDPEFLRERYVQEKMTAVEISEELGCSRNTVHDWLEEHGIEKRGQGDYASIRPATYFTNASAGYYPGWRTSPDGGFFPVHRLLAVSEFGYDAVKDKYVHHKSGIPWDNRPSNIEPMTPSEHTSMHSREMHQKGMYSDESLERSRDENGNFAKGSE